MSVGRLQVAVVGGGIGGLAAANLAYTSGMEHSPTSAPGTDGSARPGARRSGRR
jgi:flavin-dependent dehydrogenase